MSTVKKLTKRQKKGIAFRDRKAGKSNRPGTTDEVDDHDVPILEDQDLAEIQDHNVEPSQEGAADAKVMAVGRSKKNKGKAENKSMDVVEETTSAVVVGTKKRRREAEDGTAEGTKGKQQEAGSRKAKRRKESVGEVDGTLDTEVTEGTGEEPATAQTKQRFILFLGNLKYTTSLETIQTHFAACDPPPSIRLLTPKPIGGKLPSKPITKSKGCAFLEFKHRNALQQGLKLHHTQLDGRQINVELTAGGGGKSEARIGKVKERNKELEAQRRKRQEKQEKQPAKEQNLPRAEGAARFSATSGAEQVITKDRTWTVGDTEDTETHRGGKKHVKRGKGRRPNLKDWGTGVNAIPVG
ncbi:hypothetical protein BJ138DRAFT_316160 [Hygrophoropsis aurantiaca]|uniref:Uncharacterized protein n=1 Tax=Hygrophoropsis aurantiaca TaxID=72124 RepID=A0ACB8AMT2_9AGAM|nr:hypothetical protein BJ138DRAFT_316160 [Hygrophoropsis aurantiaca]